MSENELLLYQYTTIIIEYECELELDKWQKWMN